MKRLAFLIVAIVLMHTGLAWSDDTVVAQFSCPDGTCTVLIPGTVKSDTQQVALNRGTQSTTLYEYWSEIDNNNVSYMVMYNDYPANLANDPPQQMLEQFRNGAVKGKTLLTDQAIWLNGVPGREFTSIDTDNWSYHVRQFFKNKRLYQLIIVTNQNYTAKYSDVFLNSFKLN
jgi:hypothetical protein